MLKSTLIHPQILNAIASAGHGAQILITDGNYPSSTEVQQGVEKVYLNLTSGLINVTDVLKVLVGTINIEEVTVKAPEDGPEPEIFNEFREILGSKTKFNKVGTEFNNMCKVNDKLVLIIVTAEQRIYANILLTMGLVLN